VRQILAGQKEFVLASCAERASDQHDLLMISEFELSDVTLTEGPFRESMDVNLEYLLSLDADRFYEHSGIMPD
jgi:hypothetical protein